MPIIENISLKSDGTVHFERTKYHGKYAVSDLTKEMWIVDRPRVYPKHKSTHYDSLEELAQAQASFPGWNANTRQMVTEHKYPRAITWDDKDSDDELRTEVRIVQETNRQEAVQRDKAEHAKDEVRAKVFFMAAAVVAVIVVVFLMIMTATFIFSKTGESTAKASYIEGAHGSDYTG